MVDDFPRDLGRSEVHQTTEPVSYAALHDARARGTEAVGDEHRSRNQRLAVLACEREKFFVDALGFAAYLFYRPGTRIG